MGFHSFKTCDSNESISNKYSSKGALDVKMLVGENVHIEHSYEGYGRFGGKDFFEALAELNGLKTREQGINLWFSKKSFKTPYLVRIDWQGDASTLERPEDCPHQGFFYE